MWLLAVLLINALSTEPLSDVAADFALDSDLGDGGCGVRRYHCGSYSLLSSQSDSVCWI